MRRALLAAIATIVLAGVDAGVARAQLRGWGGGGTLSYDARYARYDEAPGDLSDAVDLGVTLRGVAGRSWYGFAAGFDTHLGAGLSGGFVYDVALSPIGAGVRIGNWALLGATAGIGVGGVTDRVPFGVQFPIELFADFGLSRYFRVHAWGVRRWVLVADDRPHELSAGVQLRFNRNYEQYGFHSGNGYYVGASYDERMNTEVLGVLFGYSIHFGGRGR